MTAVPIPAQIAAVERELKFRARVYPRLIANGKMTQQKAADETAAMTAVLETLREVEAKERLV